MSGGVTVLAGPLPDVLLLRAAPIRDGRGYLAEIWSDAILDAAGYPVRFVQENVIVSPRAGTLRGVHYQAAPHAQAKLMRVAAGAARYGVVDLRPHSATFGKGAVIDLRAEEETSVFTPAGFAQGLITTADHTVATYKVATPFAPEYARALRFDDPDLALDWGCAPQPDLISPKDAAAPSWQETRRALQP